jgi:hypothetical protein
MREIDEVLRRRPGLGTLADQARALRDQLAAERGSNTPGASALTAAELRLLPMLCTHLSFPEIAAEMFLSVAPSSRRRSRSTASWPPLPRWRHPLAMTSPPRWRNWTMAEAPGWSRRPSSRQAEEP